MPQPGEIVHASETFEEPAGGGAVAAVQLRKLAGEATLFTAFGDDETGHRTDAELREHGVHVEGRFRPEPQRRAFVHLDSDGERTITVLGPRLGPSGGDDACLGPARRDRRGVRDRGRRRRRPPGAPGAHARRHPARARHACRGARGARRTRVERPGPRRALQPRRPRPRAEARRADARSGRGRVGDGERRAGALGRRRRCPARSATPTAPATASRPASRTAWAPAGRSRRRSSWRPAAARPA